MDRQKAISGLAMIAVFLSLQGCGRGDDQFPTKEEIQFTMEGMREYEEGEKVRKACQKRHEENPDSFLVDPFLLADRPAAERVRLILVETGGDHYHLSSDHSKLEYESHYNLIYRLFSVEGKSVDLRPFVQNACHTDRMYIPVGKVELIFRLKGGGDSEKQPSQSIVLTVDPGEDIYLATNTFVVTENVSVSFVERTMVQPVLLSALVAEVALAVMDYSGDTPKITGTTLNGWYVTSSTFPEAENMSWGRATELFKKHMFEGLSAQLPNIKSIAEFDINPANFSHANTEIRRRNFVEDTKLALAQAARPVAASGFSYEGRYVLTHGDSCAENMPLSRERFMEIAAHREDGVSGYFVSFAGFVYDDATATSTFNPIGPDGSFQTVMADTKPATGGSALQGPLNFEHRMTLKPHSAKHLMITEWVRTTVDPSGIYEPKVVNMRTYNDKWDKNPYFDYVGKDGYCLKHVGDVPR